jgi:hypothetical protein
LGAGGSSGALAEMADDAGAAVAVDGAVVAGADAAGAGADEALAADLGAVGADDVAGGSSGALQAVVEMTKPMIGIEPSTELRIETLRSGRHALGEKVRPRPSSYSNAATMEPWTSSKAQAFMGCAGWAGRPGTRVTDLYMPGPYGAR